uniref:Uncharacterized protein n=1 Tax=Anguilla anguilla TaxID=7936 RepID=A0A0E9UJB4_ANGAN
MKRETGFVSLTGYVADPGKRDLE